MYRALCLHVLGEVDQPVARNEVAELVAYAIGSGVTVTDGLRTIVLDELHRLRDDGIVACHDDQYTLCDDVAVQIPDQSSELQLHQAISDELEQIAVSLNPAVTPRELKALLRFYMELADLVARSQANFVSRGRALQDLTADFDDFSYSVPECRKRHDVEAILDVDEFIRRTLIRPTELLASYVTQLIQVTVVTHLLAWDPELEYLRSKVLSGKTLYLDSSILFALMLTSHPLHYFLRSLLRASRTDLTVNLKIKEITLAEYRQVMDAADAEQAHTHRQLRQIAKICKRDGSDPTEWIENGILSRSRFGPMIHAKA
jgi:hypothetical protein